MSFNTFDDVMKMMANHSLGVFGETWNGDINYVTLEDNKNKDHFAELLLELGQKLVNNPYPKIKGSGSKRKGQSKSEYDFINRIPSDTLYIINKKLNVIFENINKASDILKPVYIDMLVRFIFRERAISSGGRITEGKGHRDLSFYLFFEFIKSMPELSINIVELFIHYGGYQDFNHLLAHSLEINDNITSNWIGHIFTRDLDKDLRKIIGVGVNPKNGDVVNITLIRNSISSMRKSVEKMTSDERNELRNKLQLSLAGKWFPRSDSAFGVKRQDQREAHGLEPTGIHQKRFSRHREFLIAHFFFPQSGVQTKQPFEVWNMLTIKTQEFYAMIMRWILSTINLILDIPERLMADNKWDQIEPSTMSAGALHQHRLALLNEVVGGKLNSSESEDGNRSGDMARIELRHKMTKAAIDGSLKGAALDCVKFANVIWNGSCVKYFSAAERAVLHSQFMDIVKDIRTRVLDEYEQAIAMWKENGSDIAIMPLDPLNVIATIDVSGSMASAGVMGAAIVLGIIITLLSTISRAFITFDTNPKVIYLREDGDIVDWVQQVGRAPWGGSTDMDKAMHKLIDVMTEVRKRNPSFTGANSNINHIIFTDGQFNNNFCRFSNDNSDEDKNWNTFVDRMSDMFAQNNFSMPRTTFWNMNSRSSGYPASGGKKGIILLEGLSQGLMLSALGSAATITMDEKGQYVANVDPIDVFLRSIYRDDFDKVTQELTTSGKYCFATGMEKQLIDQFMAPYKK